MDKFDRIFALNQLLHSRRTPLTLKQICEHLECSKSTAKRAIEHLRDYLFAPLLYDREQRGYRLEQDNTNGYELPGLWFNESELFALLLSQRLLSDIQPGLLHDQIQPIRRRIEALLNNRKLGAHDLDRHIRILQSAHRPTNLQNFRAIASAVVQQKQLKILYHGRAHDKISERQISPQRIVYYRDNWYLDAWCHSKNLLRTFSVDRLQPLSMVDTPAKAIPDAQLDAELTGSYGIFAGTPSQTAHLRFTSHAAKWVADEHWHPQQTVTIDVDGNLDLTIPFHNPTELIRDILKYGAEVEVIAPASLRQAVADQLNAAIKIYQSK